MFYLNSFKKNLLVSLFSFLFCSCLLFNVYPQVTKVPEIKNISCPEKGCNYRIQSSDTTETDIIFGLHMLCDHSIRLNNAQINDQIKVGKLEENVQNEKHVSCPFCKDFEIFFNDESELENGLGVHTLSMHNKPLSSDSLKSIIKVQNNLK